VSNATKEYIQSMGSSLIGNLATKTPYAFAGIVGTNDFVESTKVPNNGNIEDLKSVPDYA